MKIRNASFFNHDREGALPSIELEIEDCTFAHLAAIVAFIGTLGAAPLEAPVAQPVQVPATPAPRASRKKGEESTPAPAAAEPVKAVPAETHDALTAAARPAPAEPATPAAAEPVKAAEPAPTPAATPAPAAQAAAPTAPPSLLACTSFRQVMTVMIELGHKTPEAITTECEKYRDQVPAIARLSGNLTERVGRALEVLGLEAKA